MKCKCGHEKSLHTYVLDNGDRGCFCEESLCECMKFEKPAKPRPRRRAKPFGRWSAYKPSGWAKAISFDGSAVLSLTEGAFCNRAEDIVRALNAHRVVLKRGRS